MMNGRSVTCGGPGSKARKFSKRKGRWTLAEGLWLELAERKQAFCWEKFMC